MSQNPTGSAAPLPCGGAEHFVSASGRQGNLPQVRRYAHPIETNRAQGSCEGTHAILCAIAEQNRMLCAMQAELERLAAALGAPPKKAAEGDCTCK